MTGLPSNRRSRRGRGVPIFRGPPGMAVAPSGVCSEKTVSRGTSRSRSSGRSTETGSLYPVAKAHAVSGRVVPPRIAKHWLDAQFLIQGHGMVAETRHGISPCDTNKASLDLAMDTPPVRTRSDLGGAQPSADTRVTLGVLNCGATTTSGDLVQRLGQPSERLDVQAGHVGMQLSSTNAQPAERPAPAAPRVWSIPTGDKTVRDLLQSVIVGDGEYLLSVRFVTWDPRL